MNGVTIMDGGKRTSPCPKAGGGVQYPGCLSQECLVGSWGNMNLGMKLAVSTTSDRTTTITNQSYVRRGHTDVKWTFLSGSALKLPCHDARLTSDHDDIYDITVVQHSCVYVFQDIFLTNCAIPQLQSESRSAMPTWNYDPNQPTNSQTKWNITKDGLLSFITNVVSFGFPIWFLLLNCWIPTQPWFSVWLLLVIVS